MRARRYNVLLKRRAAWRRELDNPKSKYAKHFIRATIREVTADIVACLKEQSP